ncbi:MAG: hypothetical protein Roseis2KO_06850 [Roseivirga sp.]
MLGLLFCVVIFSGMTDPKDGSKFGDVVNPNPASTVYEFHDGNFYLNTELTAVGTKNGKTLFEGPYIGFTASVYWTGARWEMALLNMGVASFGIDYYNNTASDPPTDGSWVQAGTFVVPAVPPTFGIPAPPSTAPVVSTTAATSITAASATAGGNVTSDGGETVTARGIVWSVSDTDPEIGDAGVIQDTNGNGLGVFSETLSTFPANKTIYYKAYATNTVGTSYGSVQTFNTANPIFAVSAFLEGAYNGSQLTTTLNSSIPSNQPYNFNGHAASETAGTMPSNAVDWVLAELREASSVSTALNSTKVGSAAGLLMSDGSIKATDGTSNLSINISGNTGAEFYLVVYHRNHLPIMSANVVQESGGVYSLDFTSNAANTFGGTNALVSLTGGKFGMPAGDSNSDGNIDAADLSTWRTNNGAAFTYSSSGVSDFNLDGVINAIDRNDFHRKNTAKTRQVPTT